jgi:hypothetical protein
VELFGSDLDRIPAENLRVPVLEFARVWVSAEEQHDEKLRLRIPDWYGAGVVVTCRWLARATVRPVDGRRHMAYSPVTHRCELAVPERIQAELIAADRLDLLRPTPAWLAERPGWSRAICVTLKWAWRGSGVRPVIVEPAAAG